MNFNLLPNTNACISVLPETSNKLHFKTTVVFLLLFHRMALLLRNLGLPVVPLHGQMSQVVYSLRCCKAIYQRMLKWRWRHLCLSWCYDNSLPSNRHFGGRRFDSYQEFEIVSVITSNFTKQRYKAIRETEWKARLDVLRTFIFSFRFTVNSLDKATGGFKQV